MIDGLLRLVTVDEQGRPTRWRLRRDELPGAVAAEWDAFVARRLLTTDADNGTAVIGVAHEAFLSAWPPLAEAIAKNVLALRARRAVEHAAQEWHATARPPARLWKGGQLAAAVSDLGAQWWNNLVLWWQRGSIVTNGNVVSPECLTRTPALTDCSCSGGEDGTDRYCLACCDVFSRLPDLAKSLQI